MIVSFLPAEPVVVTVTGKDLAWCRPSLVQVRGAGGDRRGACGGGRGTGR